MVTIKLEGGLANQLFQKIACIAHAKRHGLEYVLPLVVNNPHYENQKPYIFPNLNYSDNIPLLPTYTEPEFRYREIPFMDNVCLKGYFQSWRYFSDVIDDVGELFGLEYRKEKNVCSIHVRRGDYLDKPDFHPFVGEDYLINAVERINNQTNVEHFKVFSDDPDWCEDFFATFNDYYFEIVRGGNEIQDLVHGANCEHQIMSNSTFSLWQHFLNKNKNKICVAPKTWFGKDAGHDTLDLYPSKNCIKI